MLKTYRTHLLAIMVIAVTSFGSIFYKRDYIGQQIDLYSLNSVQNAFGALRLAPEQEEKIKKIAEQMGVFEPMVIRKMNSVATTTFGYGNAFVTYPCLLNLMPLSDIPFLYVSEGFFEDLSSEEQIFLIGHELTHLKERHARHLHLVAFLLFWLVMGIALFSLKKYLVASRHLNMAIFIFFLANAFGCNLAVQAYRRYIEKEADRQSLTILESYDGCIKLVDRWQREWSMPSHNPYFGLLADHPSCVERKMYCLELKTHHSAKDIA